MDKAIKTIKRIEDIEDKAVRDKFDNLAYQLSPENLYWDGERSHEEAQDDYNRLMAQWRKLEKENNIKLDPEMCY